MEWTNFFKKHLFMIFFLVLIIGLIIIGYIFNPIGMFVNPSASVVENVEQPSKIETEETEEPAKPEQTKEESKPSTHGIGGSGGISVTSLGVRSLAAAESASPRKVGSASVEAGSATSTGKIGVG